MNPSSFSSQNVHPQDSREVEELCYGEPLRVKDPLLKALNLDKYHRKLYPFYMGGGKRVRFFPFAKTWLRKFRRTADGRAPTSAVDEMFTHSPVLPTSMLKKMNRRERKRCVVMFSHVRAWTSYSNGQQHVKERADAWQGITQIVRSNPLKKDELLLQLVKQTRGNPNPSGERNTWKLLKLIGSVYTFSDDVLDFAIEYFQSVVTQGPGADPVIKHMALELLQKFDRKLSHPLHANGSTCVQCNGFYASTPICIVHFLDNESVPVIYDSHTRVEDVVPQIAWTLGLQDHDTFALYECRGEQQMLINGNHLLTSVVNEKRFLDNNERGTRRLLMKKKIIGYVEQEKNDPRGFVLTYYQVKDQYLRGGYPLATKHAIQLFVFLVLAECRLCAVSDEKLRRLLEEFIPPTILNRENRDVLLNKVRQELKESEKIESGEARFRFAEWIQSIPYGNCQLFQVQEVESPVTVLPKHRQLLLAVHRSGLDFFLDAHGESLLTIYLDDVDPIETGNTGVTLVQKKKTAHPTLWLQMEEGTAFCEVIKNHKRIFGEKSRMVRPSVGGTAASDRTNSDIVPPCYWMDGWNGPYFSSSSGGTRETSSGMDDIYEAGPSRRPGQQESGKSSKSSYMGTDSQSGSQETGEQRSSTTSSGSRAEGTSSNGRPKSDKRHSSRRKNRKPPRPPGEAPRSRSCDLVMDTYEVTGPANNRDPFTVAAVGIYCKTKVILNFCGNENSFEEAKERHAKRKNRTHICKLLRPVSGNAASPSCLVFERGDVTLEEWIVKGGHTRLEKMRVALEICLLVEVLHSEGIVHGDLKPSNLYYFHAEDAWKILETDTVSVERKPPPIHYTATPEYAAPEVLVAESRGLSLVPLTAHSDIYSLGIIFYELFQGKKFYPPEMSHEVIYAILPTGKLTDYAASIEDDTIRSIIDGCLHLNPDQRRTATEMCDAEIFKTARDAALPDSRLENLIQHRPLLDKEQTLASLKHQPFQVHPASAEEPIPSDIDISLCLEESIENSLSRNLTDARGMEVLTMKDSELEGQTIFILDGEQKAYRLRMIIDDVAFDRSPFLEIVQMSIALPNSDPVELQMSAATTAFQHEAVAVFRIEDLLNKDVRSRFACCYRNSGECFGLDIVVGARILSTARTTQGSLTIRGKIYCKLLESDARVLCCPEKIALHKASRYTPRWAKFSVRKSRCLGGTAYWESDGY